MKTELLPRVFFDTNEGSYDGGYWLILDQSKSDLATLGDQLRTGARVVIWMPDELEMEARLRFEDADDWGSARWVADPVPGTIKYLNQG